MKSPIQEEVVMGNDKDFAIENGILTEYNAPAGSYDEQYARRDHILFEAAAG